MSDNSTMSFEDSNGFRDFVFIHNEFHIFHTS
jgi:hypothetical protein